MAAADDDDDGTWQRTFLSRRLKVGRLIGLYNPGLSAPLPPVLRRNRRPSADGRWLVMAAAWSSVVRVTDFSRLLMRMVICVFLNLRS